MRHESPFRVFLGFDADEMMSVNVANRSLLSFAPNSDVKVDTICRLRVMREYRRPTSRLSNGQLFDEISQAPMSTDHAIARFFIPYLCDYTGWALFTDGDVLFRDDVRSLFALADAKYALQVVHQPPQLEEGMKKDGHVQQAYPRKNWSSVMLFNCGHPSNRALTVDVCNTWPGRDLHAFRWLHNDEIGDLPQRWNWLCGVSAPDPNPALVHYTLGTPNVPGCEDAPFAHEWRAVAVKAGYHVEKMVAEVL